MIAKIFFLLPFRPGCLFCSCASQLSLQEPKPVQHETETSTVNEPPDILNPEDRFDRPLLDAKGLVILGEYKESRDMLQFYNHDGTVWHEFTFYYDDKDGHFEHENADFLPFSFHPDYFTLALRLMGEDSQFYEVVVNEEKPVRKYIKKRDKRFKFVTWQKHILETFAIDFDKKLNPVRQSPNGSPKPMKTVKVDRYGAKSFDGDWLKVEWDVSGSEHDDDSRKDSGWIRWRQGNRLLIDWFYFA